ncbi:hypothetical protein [Pelomonas sp. Root1237]|uniref:phosphoribosyltransferase-like protein n=1 Tax=Pelomonas sp. Root1237 TaxID=1736434 RepID=UPI0007017673|nr:hypothetical protein [Pelomonas sp. Root1237]KQV96641.1 hypothetical protein ASC91_03630 [Pelomonas sp. Root1237]
MTFHVAEKHAGLFEQVERRFRLLLSRNVVTGITETQFDKWLSNLVTDEEQYLGARLLENLTFRSEPMVGSAIGHILECILPSELRRSGAAVRSVDEFVASLRSPGMGRLVRFVEVDDPKGRTPGKSGALVMRELHRLGGVDKSLTCLPENIGTLPKAVKCLVFVDDMLGTGTQFKAFCDKYKLEQEAANRTLIYCPLAAFHTGLDHLATECPWMKVCPVEQFGEQHRFFRGDANKPEMWAVDQVNTVADVRQFVEDLCKSHGIRAAGDYALELLLGFHHATPNNTLPIMYAQTATWNNLLIR